jgi:peptide/nickel transport system ATP-binding protein/oligopeptide transport system ATP-binding protein
MEAEKILEAKNLKKYFPVQSNIRMNPKSVKAVDDVSFHVYKGETLSLVGESGCGKSTTGRCAIGLLPITSGEVLYEGKDISKVKEKERRALTKELQMIFQDPYSSLNPRMTIGSIIEETLLIHKIAKTKIERMHKAMDMLQKVGIREDQYYRYPHEFSGGQKQRIGIARALILNPKLIVCDEPVSALDVSIQSQVLNLLTEMKKEMDVTYLFISHNMSVVRYISDRVGVMYLGHLVELALTQELYDNPLHPYTQVLLSAVPEVNPHIKKEQILLEGDIPSPLNPPSGCVFHNRCPYAETVCQDAVPQLQEISPGHFVACFRHEVY